MLGQKLYVSWSFGGDVTRVLSCLVISSVFWHPRPVFSPNCSKNKHRHRPWTLSCDVRIKSQHLCLNEKLIVAPLFILGYIQRSCCIFSCVYKLIIINSVWLCGILRCIGKRHITGREIWCIRVVIFTALWENSVQLLSVLFQSYGRGSMIWIPVLFSKCCDIIWKLTQRGREGQNWIKSAYTTDFTFLTMLAVINMNSTSTED